MARFLPSIMVASTLKKLDLELNMKGIEKDLPDYIKSGLMMLYKTPARRQRLGMVRV